MARHLSSIFFAKFLHVKPHAAQAGLFIRSVRVIPPLETCKGCTTDKGPALSGIEEGPSGQDDAILPLEPQALP